MKKYFMIDDDDNMRGWDPASEDDMPDNGLEAFYEIENVLSTAWSQNYSSLDTETWFCPNCGTKNNRRYCMECGVEKPE